MSQRRSKLKEGDDVELESISGTFGDNSCDPTDKFWSLYLKQTSQTDRAMVEDWKGTTDGILIFAGLFSAVVTAFIIESYKNLQPQTDDLTLLAITQLSLQLASITVNGTGSNNSSPVPAFSTDLTHFKPTKTATWVNIFWFMSLFFSLTCALTATLVQQWSREYIQSIERYQIPRQRGQVRAHLFQGMTMYKMSGFMDAIPALLHISLFTFFAGLFMMIHPINTTVGIVLFCLFLFGSALYLFTSVIALYYHSYPFSTPLSQWFLRFSKIWRHNKKTGKLSRLREAAAQGNEGALLEAYSYVLMAANEDREFDELLEVLPDFYVSQRESKVLTGLLDEFYRNQGFRIKQLLDDTETLQGRNRDRKVINFLNFMYTAARLTANPTASRTITDTLTVWADHCSGEYLDEPNNYISNLAFAVVAHAISCTKDRMLVHRRECDLTMTQTVDILDHLRNYQLPSLVEKDQKKVPSTRPFGYVVSCFQRYHKLRCICPQVYFIMITADKSAMDAAFVQIAYIFLVEIYKAPLNPATKEVLEVICMFLCHLEDETALKNAMSAIRKVAEDHAHDRRLGAARARCELRLEHVIQRAKRMTKDLSNITDSTLTTPPRDEPHTGYATTGGFGSSGNNRPLRGMHKYSLSDDPTTSPRSVSNPLPSTSQVPQTPPSAGFGQNQGQGQHRHPELSPMPPLRLSLPPGSLSPGFLPGHSPNPPNHPTLPPGAAPSRSRESLPPNPNPNPWGDVPAGLIPGSGPGPGPGQSQHTSAHPPHANPNPISRPGPSHASPIQRPSSGMSYGAGYTYAAYGGEDDDESDHEHGDSYRGNRSGSRTGIARSGPSASRGGIHRKDRTDYNEFSRLVD